MPVLVDHARKITIPESSIIIEYLAQHYPGAVELIPEEPDRARDTRLRDRFFDSYVHEPMQKIVLDKLRPSTEHDRFGVNRAKAQLETAYGSIDSEMEGKQWALGAEFSMADCAARQSITPIGWCPLARCTAQRRRIWTV